MAATLYMVQPNGTVIASTSFTPLGFPNGIVYMGQGQFIAQANKNWAWFNLTFDGTTLSIFENKQVNDLHAALPNFNQAMKGMCTDGVFIYITFNSDSGQQVPTPFSGIAQMQNDGTFIRHLSNAQVNILGYQNICYDGVFFYVNSTAANSALIQQWEFHDDGADLPFTRTGSGTDIINAMDFYGKDFFMIDNQNPDEFFVADRVLRKNSGVTALVDKVKDLTWAAAEDLVFNAGTSWTGSRNPQRVAIMIARD